MTDSRPGEDIHQHSGWLIPLGFALAVAVLSAAIMGWYLRPGPRSAAPTPKDNIVRLTVEDAAFAIPANYIETRAARTGGAQGSVALAALYPSWRGYSDADAKLFSDNAPDQPVIRMTLRHEANSMDGAARLERIYKPYLDKPQGRAGPFGLTQYAFRTGTGYERNDLFAGASAQGLVLLLCDKGDSELSSPSCFAVDRPLAANVGFSYRFKRTYLARWKEIAAGASALVRRFETAN